MDIQNKVALITGGNSGMGRAIAKAIAAEGGRVALMARNEQRLKEIQLPDRAAIEEVTIQAITLGMRFFLNHTEVEPPPDDGASSSCSYPKGIRK